MRDRVHISKRVAGHICVIIQHLNVVVIVLICVLLNKSIKSFGSLEFFQVLPVETRLSLKLAENALNALNLFSNTGQVSFILAPLNEEHELLKPAEVIIVQL